jgi:hypothetical protein
LILLTLPDESSSRSFHNAGATGGGWATGDFSGYEGAPGHPIDGSHSTLVLQHCEFERSV